MRMHGKNKILKDSILWAVDQKPKYHFVVALSTTTLSKKSFNYNVNSLYLILIIVSTDRSETNDH